MNQKEFTNIVLIVVLIAIAGGAGTYFVVTKQFGTPSQNQSTKDHKITFVFLDKTTDRPIINRSVIIQERWLCEPGAHCNPPVLLKGSTDSSGRLSVENTLFAEEFNILIEGYFGAGPFQKCSKNADTICYPNPKKVASDSFSPSTDSEITVIVEAQN